MFTRKQIEELEGVLRRAAEDREYLEELSQDMLGVLNADAGIDLPTGATTRTVASDAADFTIVLSASPKATTDDEPTVVVVDQPGDRDDTGLEGVAHLEPAIPGIVEKSLTDSNFRQALVADPAGALRQHFNLDVRSSLQIVDPLASDYTLIARPRTTDRKRHPVIVLPGYSGGRVDAGRTGVQLVLTSSLSGEMTGSELGAVAGGVLADSGKDP